MSTHNIPFLNIKKKFILKYPKSATIGFVPRDPRTSLNQPSTHNIPFLNIKKKFILNYPKSAIIGFVPRDPRTSLNQPW